MYPKGILCSWQLGAWNEHNRGDISDLGDGNGRSDIRMWESTERRLHKTRIYMPNDQKIFRSDCQSIVRAVGCRLFRSRAASRMAFALR